MCTLSLFCILAPCRSLKPTRANASSSGGTCVRKSADFPWESELTCCQKVELARKTFPCESGRHLCFALSPSSSLSLSLCHSLTLMRTHSTSSSNAQDAAKPTAHHHDALILFIHNTTQLTEKSLWLYSITYKSQRATAWNAAKPIAHHHDALMPLHEWTLYDVLWFLLFHDNLQDTQKHHGSMYMASCTRLQSASSSMGHDVASRCTLLLAAHTTAHPQSAPQQLQSAHTQQQSAHAQHQSPPQLKNPRRPTSLLIRTPTGRPERYTNFREFWHECGFCFVVFWFFLMMIQTSRARAECCDDFCDIYVNIYTYIYIYVYIYIFKISTYM